MAKDTFWFTHDYNARNDDKILELRSEYGAEGYGIFWMIVESMAENENGGAKASLIGGLSHGYGVAKDKLLAIISFCLDIGLFYEKDGWYFSKRMLLHKNERNLFREAGKNGAKKRWKNQKKNSPPIASPMLKTEQNRTEHNTYKKQISINGENGFNKYPTDKDCDLLLPEIYSKKAIEYLEINKQITKSEGQIIVMWEFFKLQNFNGKKFYEHQSDIYTHFLRTLNNEKNGTNNRQSNPKPELSYDKP